MIIVQTPLRISLFGGGTDLPSYFLQEGGCVLNSAIDKYIFVVIKKRFDHMIRVGYTKTEMVECVDQVRHELIREALRKTGISDGVEIATMGDIPSAGSGLGSSSTVTVGSLHAMYTYLGEMHPASCLAEEACEIEIDVLGKPVGYQDQYIAAFGGIRFMEFRPDGTVEVERVPVEEATLRRLDENLMLFYTGKTRKSSTILTEQNANVNDRLPILERMKLQALEARDGLVAGEVHAIGELMHEGWELKKRLASRISNPVIDDMYARARSAGALGGKITGAGGGGFLMLYCPKEKQDEVRGALSDLRELSFHLEGDGSKVIFNYRR